MIIVCRLSDMHLEEGHSRGIANDWAPADTYMYLNTAWEPLKYLTGV